MPTIVRSLGVNPTTAALQSLQAAIAAATSAAAPGAPDATTTTSSNGSSTTTNSSSFVALEQCETLIASWLMEAQPQLARDDFHLLMRAFAALDPDNR
jgi:hypothetical protein